jgi:hypothetical protein
MNLNINNNESTNFYTTHFLVIIMISKKIPLIYSLQKNSKKTGGAKKNSNVICVPNGFSSVRIPVPIRRIPSVIFPSWWKRNIPQKWFGIENLVRLSVSNGSSPPIPVGEGVKKRAYFAHAFFKDPITDKISKMRVVVKVFKNPISDETAFQYMKLVKFLREHKIPVPKGSMVKITKEMVPSMAGVVGEGQWVAVQQFFGTGRKTNIVDRFVESKKQITIFSEKGISFEKHNDMSLMFYGKKVARTDAVKIFAMLANIGVLPKFDLLAPLKKGSKIIGSIPFDFDLIVEEMHNSKELPSNPVIAHRLIQTIKLISISVPERIRLLKVCIQEIKSPELRKELVRLKDELKRMIDDREKLEMPFQT